MSALRRHGSPNATFAVLAVGAMAYSLLQSFVIPVLPLLQRDLHTTQTGVTWILTSYLLSASVATPILGRLGDLYGKERMLVVTLGSLGVGTAVSALATSLPLMLAGRLIQGIGGAIFPLAFGIMRDELPRERVAGGIGIITGTTSVGGGLAIVLAGPVSSHLGYHWLFWLPFVLIVVATALAWLFVPASPVRAPGSLNLLGSLLLSGWLVALLIGVSQGPAWGWGSPGVLGLVGTSAVVAVLWILAETRAAQPLVDMRMMRLPAVWWTNLVALLFGFVMFASFALLPEFLQAPRGSGYGFHATITQSGLFLIPNIVTGAATGFLVGRVSRRFGSKALTVLGAAVGSSAFLLLAVAHHATWEVYVATGLQGMGIGLAFAAMSSLIVDAVPAEQTGIASGMNANIRTIGGAIGGQVTASIVTSGVAVGALPHESGYTAAFAVMAAMGLLAAGAAVLVPARRAALVERAAPAEAVERGGLAALAATPGGVDVGLVDA